MTDDALARRLTDAILASYPPPDTDDATASLFCEVHGDVTLHVLLAGNRWECAEALSTGYCGETRDGRSEGEGMYGEAIDDGTRCPDCGAVVARYEGLSLLPDGCPLCGCPLPLPTSEEES